MLYPIDTDTRTTINLNGLWKFLLADANTIVDVNQPLATDDVMAVPGSYNSQAPDNDIRYHIGDVWYEKTFTIAHFLKNERIVLRFGSVTHYAEVYLNGQQVVSHKGGFTPFECDITEKVTTGSNILKIKVNNILDYSTLPVGVYKEIAVEGQEKPKVYNEPNFDFFNFAGIHRPVKIYTTPKEAYIKDIIVNYDIEDSNSVIKPKTQTSGNFDHIRYTIFDNSGEVVATGTDSDQMMIDHFTPWAPLKPYHYHLRCELLSDDQVIDVYTEDFGIRSVSVENGQFLINDKPFYFKGFGKHEDTPINGRGLNEAANVLDINLLKWIGANSFRTSHYPYSEEMMRLADQQGIVVIDEVPAVGLFVGFNPFLVEKAEVGKTFDVIQTQAAHQQVIEELIDRDKNLASVVMWSVANEPATHEPGSREYFEPLIKHMKAYDPQHRPITMALIGHSTPDTNTVSDLLDVIGLNRYYGWYIYLNDFDMAEFALRKELTQWQAKHPDTPIIFLEYGADAVSGYHSTVSEPFTEEYQVEYYQVNHKVFDEFDLVIGEHAWNFADFETAPATKRVKGNKKGIFNQVREPKMIAQYFKERWHQIGN